jgi:hypothetical protein
MAPSPSLALALRDFNSGYTCNIGRSSMQLADGQRLDELFRMLEFNLIQTLVAES